MFDPYVLAGPLLRRMDPETAHRMGLKALKCGLAGRDRAPADPRLAVSLWGRTFANPVGLAAGFDKNAEAADALLGLGFGFVEVGGVTPRPQPGNPRPRVFRLPEDGAVINRMGFNNDGLDVVRARLAARDRSGPGLLGVNLGKNKDTEDAASDYEKGAAAFAPLADFLVINVSSPNTPGLRALQGRGPLVEIIQRTHAALRKTGAQTPLLLKIAPDLTAEDEEDIAAVALSEHSGGRLDGLVVSNTTITRPETLKGASRRETGGLSGRPVYAMSTALLGRMAKRTGGSLPLIGVGGIASAADAYAKIRAGATLVQLYTALIYGGPSLVQEIKAGLLTLLERDGFASIADAVGADHR